METEEVGKEEEAPGEAVLLVQEFLCPPRLLLHVVKSFCLDRAAISEPLALRGPVLWAAARLAGAAASI